MKWGGATPNAVYILALERFFSCGVMQKKKTSKSLVSYVKSTPGMDEVATG